MTTVTQIFFYLRYEAGHFVAIESVWDVPVDVEVGHFSAGAAISSGGLCLFHWLLQYALLFVGCKLSEKFINSLGCCRCTIGGKWLLFASRSSWLGRPATNSKFQSDQKMWNSQSISLMVRGTPAHVKCYSYHAVPSVISCSIQQSSCYTCYTEDSCRPAIIDSCQKQLSQISFHALSFQKI